MDLASGIAGLTSLALELTTITYNYIRDVKNAPEESKQVHNELTALKTCLESLREFLDSQNARQIPFTRTSALVASTQVCNGDLGYIKLRLADFRELYDKKKWYRRLAWPFQKEEHTQVLRRIKDYTQTFHFSVSLEGCDLLAKTSAEVDEIHKQQRDSSRNVSEIFTIIERLNTSVQYSIECQRHQLADIKKSLQDDERKNLLDWLSKVDPSRSHNAATERKEPETGEWFIQSDEFTQWVESAGLIWLYGIPGGGKTVLCSSIIECIQDLCRASDTCKSAYFYFSFQSTAEQNLDVVLRSLLRQLSANEPRVPSAVQRLYDKHQEIGHSPSTKDLKDALIDTIQTLGKEVYIMLDALDEILEDGKERTRVLKQVATFASLGLRNLHLLATSRDEWDIRRNLGPHSGGGISIQNWKVDQDISKYVDSCLQELTDLSQEVKTAIQNKVGSKAHGGFRWAACQIETIQECDTVTEIEEALNDLPKTLDETYERVLQNMWRNSAEKAKAILTWLLFSKRPLTLQEVAEAAVFRPGDTMLTSRDRLTQHTVVLRICRSFIKVSNEKLSPLYGGCGSREGEVVRFAHFSVAEYLVSGRSNLFTGILIPSHNYIGDCCVSMLLQADHLRLQTEEMEDLVNRQSLLRYAAGSWFFHIEQLETRDKLSRRLSSGVYKLLDRGSGSENFHTWMEIYEPVEGEFMWSPSTVTAHASSIQTPLFYACRLGLVDATHYFIKAGGDVNQHVPRWGTPLHMASMQGSYKVIEMLLLSGADAKVRDYNGRTAFGCAVLRGQEKIRRLLLDHGIDSNAELRHAAHNYDLEIVRFLLQNGVNANYALQAAVRSGCFQIVEFIVQKIAGLNADTYARALFEAARAGHSDIFEFLLGRGASIMATRGDGLNIVLAAVQGGSLEIISRLVELGVDINAPGIVEVDLWWSGPRFSYATALQYAAYTNNHKMIKGLLNNDAEVNRPGFSFGTELQAALRSHADSQLQWMHRVEDTVRLLLEHGANVNQQVQTRSLEIPSSPLFRRKGTALQQAAAQGLGYVAQLLTRAGADINAQHNHCGTALICASRHSKPKTLQVLVDMKADVNAHVAGIGSALSEAARWGRCENVQFLVDNGADVDANVGDVGTALLTALQYGQIETAIVLIEAGADLRIAIQDMGSAFSMGSEHEGREIVKFCVASYQPYPRAWDPWDRLNL